MAIVEKGDKAVIVIPAHNEAGNIGKTIDLIRETNLNVHIIVVNDGSTDKTSEVAKGRGCEVIDLPRNTGKANAFFAGIKRSLDYKPIAVVTLDADMISVPSNGLETLIKLASNATKAKRVQMITSPHGEGSSMPSAFLSSGIRAFSRDACVKLKAVPIKKRIKGFGLEMFLTHFFLHQNEFVPNEGFISKDAFRRAPQEAQVHAYQRTSKILYDPKLRKFRVPKRRL